MPAAQISDVMIGCASAPVTISPRQASASTLTGLFSTIGCSQPGIVSAGAKTLLMNVIGKSAVKPNNCTCSGSLATTPTSTDTHENARANTSTSATAPS